MVFFRQCFEFCVVILLYVFFKLLGLALYGQVLMSAAYHLCPSVTSNQFDTTFVYIIVLLGLFKVLTTRAPDLSPALHRHACFLMLIIIVVVLGEVCNSMHTRYRVHTCIYCTAVDNHDSGYLGLVVQLYVQAHLGHYHFLIQKDYSQKLMVQLKSMPLFTYMCTI